MTLESATDIIEKAAVDDGTNSGSAVLTVFQASPLEADELDIEGESYALRKAVEGTGLHLQFKRATSSNFIDFLSCSSKLMHFSGHGGENYLLIENEYGGGSQEWRVGGHLTRWLEVGGNKLELLFISACHSRSVGQACADVGVKHVICAKTDNDKINEKAAIIFAEKFYYSLARGSNVQDAYNRAVFAVLTASQLTNAQEEADKFILLPEGNDHDVALVSTLVSPMKKSSLGAYHLVSPLVSPMEGPYLEQLKAFISTVEDGPLTRMMGERVYPIPDPYQEYSIPIWNQKEVQAEFVQSLKEKGKYFRKRATSFIRKARKGERIVTMIGGARAFEETVNDDTSYVVRGEGDGEFSVLKNKVFHEIYDESSKMAISDNPEDPLSLQLREEGFLEYKSNLFVAAREVDEEDLRCLCYGADAQGCAYFEAPWGEAVRVKKGDYLVTQHIPNGISNNEIFSVERAVFEDFYVVLSEQKEEMEATFNHALKDRNEDIQSDKDSVGTADKEDWTDLVSKDFSKSDEDTVVTLDVEQNAKNLVHPKKKAKTRKDAFMDDVNNSSMVFKKPNEEKKSDKDIVSVAVGKDGMALEFANEDMKGDREIVLAAVKQNWCALQYASKYMKGDRDVVLVAVKQNGFGLEYAAESLRGDRDLVLTAVKQNGNALRFASDNLRADKEVVLAAVQNNFDAMQFAKDELKQDRDCLTAAGIWDMEQPAASIDPSSTRAKPFILSTRFSLQKDSKSLVRFTKLLNENGKKFRDNNVKIFSPDAFENGTCDPKWTNMSWPCRGTTDSCMMVNKLKDGKPHYGCCWRFSFRWHLERAKNINGGMIQVVDYVKKLDHYEYELSDKQKIEKLIAEDLGTKIFRIYLSFNFPAEYIDILLSKIKSWEEDGCKDMASCEVYFKPKE